MPTASTVPGARLVLDREQLIDAAHDLYGNPAPKFDLRQNDRPSKRVKLNFRRGAKEAMRRR